MSAVFSLNLIRVKSFSEVIPELQKSGYGIYAAALSEQAKSIYDTVFSEKTALLFGSEANGIELPLLSMADSTYIIPMQSAIESLNVAVAAGVSMYEVHRREII